MAWSIAVLLALFLAQDSYRAAMTSYGKREYAKAVEQFGQALKDQKPGSAEYQETILRLAQCLYLTSQFDKAIPWLEKAAASGSRRLEASYMLGNAYVQTHRAEQAVVAFAQMFGVSSDSAPAHLLTAQMMVRLGFEEAGQKQAAQALDLNPRIPEAHYLLGELATFHGQIDDAVLELKKEIEINPNFAMAYYKLGDAYTRREQWQEAIPELERSVWLNPTYSGPYILLGKAYFKQEDFTNAEQMLRQSLKMDPQNLSAHYMLAQTLMKLGHAEEARKVLARWQELQKQH